MIILDTHIWVWWVHGDAHLPNHYRTYLEGHETQGLGVSVISCWEVAKLVETWRLGVSPEEIPSHLPHVTLAQVFDALSYYSAHQAEIDTYIARNRIPDALIDPLITDP